DRINQHLLKMCVKSLQDHHEHPCEKLFEATISHPNHKIGKLSVSNKTRGELQFKEQRTFNAYVSRTRATQSIPT
ncbi:Hypothetical predicted protein, partial [Paramuricea clavata]